MSEYSVNPRWTNFSLPSGLGQFKLAVVGAGSIIKKHLEVFTDIPGVNIVGVSTPSGASAEALVKVLGQGKAYTDHFKMISETKPDGILVGVSHLASFSVYKELLSLGIPMLIEKPAATSLVELEQLLEVQEKYHTPCMVGVNRRYYSHVHAGLLAMAQTGEIRGLNLSINERLFDFRSRLQFPKEVYDQWLFYNSIHFLDLYLHIGGSVSSYSITPFISMPNSATISMQFANGIVGTANIFFDSGAANGIEVIGHGSTLVCKPLETSYIHYATGRVLALTPDPMDVKFKMGFYWQNTSFIDFASSGSMHVPHPGSSLSDQIAVTRILGDIEQSCLQGKASRLLTNHKL